MKSSSFCIVILLLSAFLALASAIVNLNTDQVKNKYFAIF
jgi:hypothetical protein